MTPRFGAGLVIESRRSQLARRYPRGFTFYVADPISSIPDLWPQEAVRTLKQRKDPPLPRLWRDKRGGAGADRIGQDLHLRAALSESENSGGVHRPDPRSSNARSRAALKITRRQSCIISGL